MSFFTKMSLGKNSFFSDDDDSVLGSDSKEQVQDTLFREEETIASRSSIQQEQELKVNVYSMPDEIVVLAAVAGCMEEDVRVSVKEGVLMITIKQELPEEFKELASFAHTEELEMGERSRPIILPEVARIEEISAKLLDSQFLVVRIPKSVSKQERTIRIELE